MCEQANSSVKFVDVKEMNNVLVLTDKEQAISYYKKALEVDSLAAKSTDHEQRKDYQKEIQIYLTLARYFDPEVKDFKKTYTPYFNESKILEKNVNGHIIRWKYTIDSKKNIIKQLMPPNIE